MNLAHETSCTDRRRVVEFFFQLENKQQTQAHKIFSKNGKTFSIHSRGNKNNGQ